MFDFGKLDSKTMAAFKESSAKMEIKRSDLKMPGIVSTEMLRAFTIFDTLTRFVMPLCSAIPSRKYPDVAVTKMLCVVDISGMGLRQFWNMRGYMQDFSKLVGINYPEILDHVLVRLSFTSLPCDFLFTKDNNANWHAPDHWSTFLLPNGLELDQEMGRRQHRQETPHPAAR